MSSQENIDCVEDLVVNDNEIIDYDENNEVTTVEMETCIIEDDIQNLEINETIKETNKKLNEKNINKCNIDLSIDEKSHSNIDKLVIYPNGGVKFNKISLTIDNGNTGNMFYQNDISFMELASIFIIEKCVVQNISCLNLKLYGFETIKDGSKIETKIFNGIEPDEVFNPKRGITFIYKDQKIKYYHILDKSECGMTLSLSHSASYREYGKFEIESVKKENLQEKIKLLNSLVNEIIIKEHEIFYKKTIFYIMCENYWYRPKSNKINHKNFDCLCYPDQIKNNVISKIDNFMKNKDDYNKFGKNYKISFILEGIPGTGKTSFVQSVANYYSLPIYQIPHNCKICDQDLIRNINSIDKNYFILFIEDFDKMMVNITEDKTETLSKNTGVSFSGFTNLLDGTYCRDGMIIFFTTNKISDIESTLKRTGRIDSIINFSFCEKKQYENFFNKCFDKIEETERNDILNKFYKKVKNLKYTISVLSEYFFKHKNNPDQIPEDIDYFKELINQSSYGEENKGKSMII